MISAKNGNSPSPISSTRDSATSPTLMNKLLLLLLLVLLLLLLLHLTSKIKSSSELRRKEYGKKVVGVDAVVVFAIIRFVGAVLLGCVTVFICSGDNGDNASTSIITARRRRKRLLHIIVTHGIE